jgi:AraC-like DNA-binding protein
MFRTLKPEDWFHQDGFPIAVERREPQPPFGPHKHRFSEIVLITGGRGLHVAGGESWPLSAGDIFVIGGPVGHDYRDLENLCLVNVLFRPDKLDLKLLDLATLPGYHALFNLEPAWRRRHQFKSRLHIAPAELAAALAIVEQLERELKRRAPGFGFLALALFMQLVGYLSRCYGQSRNPNSRALLRMAEAIAHLETHFHQPVHLDQLAQIARMSKRSFMRAFRAATGVPPISYLIRQRVNRAAVLLRNGNESITEIAFEAGFTDSNYFSRQFRQVFGLTPSDYRKRQGRVG